MKLAESILAMGRGFAVLPTYAKRGAEDSTSFTPKLPAIPSFGHDAATTIEEIHDMWNGTNESGKNPLDSEGKPTKWKGLFQKGVYGVGISCRRSDPQLFVLDIDKPDHAADGQGADGEESLKALEEQYGPLPRTFTTQSGTGGPHKYFKMPKGVTIKNQASIAPGIDIRSPGLEADGDGGQVVAPGNVFAAPDGTIREYTIIDDSPIAELPAAWAVMLSQISSGQQSAQQEAPKTGTRIYLEDVPQADQGRLEKWSRQAITAELAKLATTPKGDRNNTLNDVALRCIRIAMNGSIKGQGNWLRQELTQAAEEAGLSMSEIQKTISSAAKGAKKDGPAYPKDYTPPQTSTSAQAISSTPAPAAGAPAQPEEWPAIVEYGTTGEKQRIAHLMQDMPTVIRDFCEGLATSAQVPLELCLSMMLPAIATCIQGKFEVHVHSDHYEPLNIFTLCPLPPGNRKSAVVKACTKPLHEWEKKKREELQPKITKAKNDIEAANSRLAELNYMLRKISATDPAKAKEREKIQEERDIIIQNKPKVPTVPQLLVDDITPEKLASVMAAHGDRIGMISAEGGVFDILAGLYSNSGAANMQVFLKGWGAETYKVQRIRDGEEGGIDLAHPLLTMGIAPQPGIMRIRKAAERFRLSGMDARFLYFMPDSMAGSREIFPPEMPKAAKKAYQSLILTLLEVPYADGGKPTVLELSTDAKSVWGVFAQQMEEAIRPGGDMAEMSDWAQKAAGAAARLAGLFHISETQGDLAQTVISVETMQTAVSLAEFLCQHAVIAYELLGGDEKSLDAQKILTWIQDNKIKAFTASECQQNFRNTTGLKDKSLREAALQDLIDRYYIREEAQQQQPTGKTGRKPGTTYQVNPAFFAGKTEGGK